jgi:hypothetical protein
MEHIKDTSCESYYLVMHNLVLVFILAKDIVDRQQLIEKGLNFNAFYLNDDINLIKKTWLASQVEPQ